MTRHRRYAATTVPTAIKVLLPPETHQDLAAIARTAGLATSTYVRTLLINHVARIHAVADAQTSKKHDD